jgi:hypothetical protein
VDDQRDPQGVPAHVLVATQEIERDQDGPDAEHARDMDGRPVRVGFCAEAPRERAGRGECRAAVEEANTGKGNTGVVATGHTPRILLDRTAPW